MLARIVFMVLLVSEFQSWGSCQVSGPFSGINHARNKTTFQEPYTLDPYTADLAVDGYTMMPNCSHTYGAYNLPSSWTVELGMSIYVTGIIVYNRERRNDENDYRYRLENFIVYGLTPMAKEVIYNDTNIDAYTQIIIRLENFDMRAFTAIQVGIPAREIPLDAEKVNALTLCEVEVYGVPECKMPNLESHVQIESRPKPNYIILSCEAGYTSTENTQLTCNNDSDWTGLQPKCNPIRCESPGKVDNGYYVVSNEAICNSDDVSELHYQCKITSICNEGYLLRDQNERTCQADGRWTNMHPICDIVTCEFPGEISNGNYIIETNTHTSYVSGALMYTTTIKGQCDTGYKMQNSTVRICESNGTWSGSDPQCNIVQCSFEDLKTTVNDHFILNGNGGSGIDADFANYNDTVNVICMTGFRPDSNGIATCSADGRWNIQTPSCKIVTCLTPKETSDISFHSLYNTSYGIFTGNMPYGASVNATCKQGILKLGSRTRYCQENGSWDGENPVCVSLCYAPKVSNGMLRDDNGTLIDMYEEGQNLSLSCFEGYESTHSQIKINCQKNHSWSFPPSCSRSKSPDGKESDQTAVVGGAVGGSIVIIAVLVLVTVIWRKRKDGITNVLKRYVRFQKSANASAFAEILVCDKNQDSNEGHTYEAYRSVEVSNKMPEGAIRVENLSDIISSGEKAVVKFTEEFKKFSVGLTEKHSEAIKIQNKGRNRYKNVYAYDETRVVLEKETSEDSDYINACYIDGFQVSREYIASQGPTEDTIIDFWKMVWQTESSKIVMLTKLFEDDKIKCVQYWPDSGSTEFGKITVSLEDTDIYTDFTLRRLELKKVGYPERTVTHFHFKSWPHKGEPKHPSSLVQFRNKVLNTPSLGTAPMIVHCSAGVGRTGTFIALDYLTKQGQTTSYVDVLGTVKALRKQRVNLVQTLEQYIFVHHALVETLMLSTSALPTSNFPEAYEDLLDVERNTGKRKLDHEYEMLKKHSSAAEEGQYEQVNIQNTS